MRIHFAAALLCAGALAGCSSTPLTQLQESTPKGTAVSQALAGAYADFAKVEVTEMVDLKDGDYFARKGLDSQATWTPCAPARPLSKLIRTIRLRTPPAQVQQPPTNSTHAAQPSFQAKPPKTLFS